MWEDVCNIDSPTNFKEGVDDVCEYFVDVAKKQGFQIEILKNEVSGNAACITMNPESDKAPVCLYIRESGL